jgi:GT2 family glycosyltransferase
LPLVSVIIPCWDSPVIDQTIEAVRRQTAASSICEVLVIGSDAHGLVEENEQVRFISNPESCGGAGDRNIGMSQARGDLFFLTDHDCMPVRDCLAQHLRRHAQGEVVVGGSVTFDTRSYLWLADNVSAYHDLLPHTSAGSRKYLSSANMSIQRSVVDAVGLMEPHFTRAEDLEWTARMRKHGYTLYFEPDAVVFHNPIRKTFKHFLLHWTTDAHDTLEVRLRYAHALATPALARYRPVFLWGAPLVAAWATARTFRDMITMIRYWHTLPLVYLSKLAWCWGAYRNFPKLHTA